jgi:HD-like signal output (HDOD) protein
MALAAGEFQQRLKAEFIRPELSIPGMPEVALRVVRRLADISATGPQVAQLAASDPTLAGLLLRSANSSDYNPTPDPTSDLGVAIRRLGFDTVRRLALSYALQQVRDAPRYRIVHGRLSALWQRSVALASIARAMSIQFSGVPRERANTAGLLHTVGHIWVTAKAATSPQVLQDPMGLEHIISEWRVPAARRLLQGWGLDPEFVHAVCEHEAVEDAAHRTSPLMDLLFISQLFNAFKDAPVELTARLVASPAAARLGMRGRERELVFSRSADEIRALREALCD